MKYFAILLTLFLLIAPAALGQVGGQNSASLSNPIGGGLTASTTNCVGVANACTWQKLPPNATTTSVVISGTFSATLQFEESADGINFIGASPASTTIPGTTVFTTAGFTDFRVRASAYVSGLVSVNITTSFTGTGGGGGGGGSTSFTSITGGTNTNTLVIGTGGSLATSGTGTIIATNGINSVTTLPALPCTNGTIVNLTTGAQGIYNCINGAFQQAPEGGNTVFVGSYGVTAAGSEDCLATFTNASGTVTLSVNAVTPTAAMIGWSMQGSAGCVDGITYTNVMPRCTITSVNSGARTLTGSGCAANANAAGTATQHVTFGPIEDAQLLLAEAPLQANTGPCPNVQFPSGFMYVTTQHFNSMTCDTQVTGSGSIGMQVQGYGRLASGFMLASDFVFSGCPSFGGVNTCFFGKAGITKQNFGIRGAQNPGTNPAAQTCVMNDGIDDFSFNIGLFGFGASLANLNAFCATSVGSTDMVIIEDGMGQTGLLDSATNFQCEECFWGNNSFSNIQTNGTNQILGTSQGGTGPVGGASPGEVQISGSGTTWVSTNDVFLPTNAINQFLCNNGAACVLNTMRAVNSTTGNIYAITSGAGHYTLNNNFATTTGAGFLFASSSATAIIDDMGGNVWASAAGKCIFNTSGTLFRQLVPTSTYSTQCNFPITGTIPYFSVRGTCTGTALAAGGTFGLYGTGPNITSTTCAGLTAATVGSGIVMDHAGNIATLLVTATAAGAGAGSGVVTVNKNGAGTTITCTIGTGTSCSDVTHTVAFAVGDLITIQFTSAAADTLAGIKAVVSAW